MGHSESVTKETAGRMYAPENCLSAGDDTGDPTVQEEWDRRYIERAQLWSGRPNGALVSEIAELTPGRVLDVGCGCGEVLIRLGERYPIRGTGIDVSGDFLAEAQKRAVGRAAESKIDFKVADAKTYLVEPASLDLVMCLGATHAFGLGCSAYRNAIEQMIPWVKPGGFLLVADGYMKQPASTEYRKLLGDSLPDEMTHAANLSTGKDLGLVPLAAWTSSEEEWDEFEWTYQRIVVRNAVMNPNDPEAMSKLSRRHEWMDAYLRWGRDTLGYGMYLFQNGASLDGGR